MRCLEGCVWAQANECGRVEAESREIGRRGHPGKQASERRSLDGCWRAYGHESVACMQEETLVEDSRRVATCDK